MRPCLVIEHTYRVAGHSKSDTNKYRSEEEINYWVERGPIRRFKDKLTAECISTVHELEHIEKKAHEIVSNAIDYALRQPEAAQDTEELLGAVYAD